MSPGTIGNWSPGIGDPTVGGWLTVSLYAAAVAVIWWLLRRADFTYHEPERWIWRILLLGLIALGVNKQLDLQSALTELGRISAHRQGWYDNRMQIQQAFIAGAAMLGITFLAALLFLAWGSHTSTLIALVGGGILVVFVTMRAVSFHHVDGLLNAELAGFRYNWIIEMGGLTWILACALWRRRIP